MFRILGVANETTWPMNGWKVSQSVTQSGHDSVKPPTDPTPPPHLRVAASPPQPPQGGNYLLPLHQGAGWREDRYSGHFIGELWVKDR